MTYVFDTHALLVASFQDWALSRKVQAVRMLAEEYLAEIVIPTMALVEALREVERWSRRTKTVDAFLDDIAGTGHYRVEPLALDHVRLLPRLGGVRELHDRLIVAHAVALDAPLITPDENIRSSGLVETIW